MVVLVVAFGCGWCNDDGNDGDDSSLYINIDVVGFFWQYKIKCSTVTVAVHQDLPKRTDQNVRP